MYTPNARMDYGLFAQSVRGGSDPNTLREGVLRVRWQVSFRRKARLLDAGSEVRMRMMMCSGPYIDSLIRGLDALERSSRWINWLSHNHSVHDWKMRPASVAWSVFPSPRVYASVSGTVTRKLCHADILTTLHHSIVIRTDFQYVRLLVSATHGDLRRTNKIEK